MQTKAMKTTIQFLLLAVIIASCADDSVDPLICHKGTIIGKIRSAGGGVAVSMETSALSTHEWNGFQHVIEALNIPRDFWVPGRKLYFTARPGTDEERGYRSADGDESAKPIIFVIDFSTTEYSQESERK